MRFQEDEFRAEVGRFQLLLSTERQRAVVNLRAIEERWARAAAGMPAEGDLVVQARAAAEEDRFARPTAEAIRHLAAAEEWQWEIGSWSTGSGEGLVSMFHVRSLQLARAWLLATEPADLGAAALLLEAVANDPNDIAAPHRAHIEALRQQLAT